MEIIYYVSVIMLGILAQKIRKFKYFAFGVMFFSYILSIAINYNAFLDYSSQLLNLKSTSIIILVVLFYGSCTFSSQFFQTLYSKKLKSRTEYADSIMDEKVQETLESIKKSIQSELEIYNDDYFISLFIIKGLFIKKAHRIGYSVGVPQIIAEWNEEIHCLQKNINDIRIYFDIDSLCLRKMQISVKRWLKANTKLRLHIPIKIGKNCSEKTIFMLCINSNTDFLSYNEGNIDICKLSCIVNILQRYCDLFSDLFDYYSSF